MAHKRGESRMQAALFPVMLDDLVGADALVRVVDAWVGALDMGRLGFGKVQAQVMGRPPYDPADLLKLYVCGYLNGVRSSRALERECLRNVEVMWLLGRLAPDHKTIADFRRQNAEALVAASASFIEFARRERLIRGEVVAIDGSKIRAVASRKALGQAGDVQMAKQAVSREIESYLAQLDAADQQDANPAPQQGAVKAALSRLRQRQAELDDELTRLAESNATMSVQTEPQARAMKSLHGAPGYNLQTAVDEGSHLIVHHEVCNDTSDIRQLAPMAQAAAAVLQSLPAIVADAGYANGEHLQSLADVGLTAYVAPGPSNNPTGSGHFERVAFTYDAQRDCHVCPAGQLLVRKQVQRREKCVVYAAAPGTCGNCSLKPQCTASKQRFVSRHFHQVAVDANARRVAERPEMMVTRRSTVEHPFATIKHHILRDARLLLRGLRGARAELSLAVLAYNLKRVSNWRGNAWAMAALAT